MIFYLSTVNSTNRIITDKDDNIILFETIRGENVPEKFTEKACTMKYQDFKKEISELYKNTYFAFFSDDEHVKNKNRKIIKTSDWVNPYHKYN